MKSHHVISADFNWPDLLVLFQEFFHVSGQGFSILQGYSVVQRGTNSPNWPAGGDEPSCLRSTRRRKHCASNCIWQWCLCPMLYNLTSGKNMHINTEIKKVLMQQLEALVWLTCVLSVISFHVWTHRPETPFPWLHLLLSSPHETARSCGFDKSCLQDNWYGHGGKELI